MSFHALQHALLSSRQLTCIEGPPGPPDEGQRALVKDWVQNVRRVSMGVCPEHGLAEGCLGTLHPTTALILISACCIMHLMHHALVFNQVDAYATCAIHVCSVHAICTDRLALCGYNFQAEGKVQFVQQAAVSVYYGHCMLSIMLTLRLSMKPGTL